jgi:hypothetical protein
MQPLRPARRLLNWLGKLRSDEQRKSGASARRPDSSGDYQRRDFENGVPGVTMLTVVADENKRREYLTQAKVMLKRNST